MKYKKINNVQELKDTLSETECGYKDFIIKLNGGAVSRKEIMLDTDGRFLINNCIDDSEQELTPRTIMNPKYTNIGVAMTKGAFYEVI